MKILTLNIGNPSVERAKKQVDWFVNINVDIIVLTEFKLSSGGEIIENHFLEKGFKIFKTLISNKEYGVFIATKNKKFILEKKIKLLSLNERMVLIKSKEVSILGIYVPPNGKDKITRKKPFLEEIVKVLTEERPTIICGDFNTISRMHKPIYKTFRAWEYEFMDRIIEMYRDNSLNDSYSWYGKTGNPYKYDYIFINKELNKDIEVKYIKDTINLKLTDHCAVMGEFKNGKI